MDSEPDPVKLVLSTPEVRQMIMEHLDVLALLYCRLVSKPWNATATDILKKRPVWIKREWNSETFHCLCKCVERSSNFPFSRLDLSNLATKRYAYMDFDCVAKLFTKFGMIFVHLRVYGQTVVNVEMIEEVLKRLLTKTSELQYLELGNLPTSTITDSIKFCLSSLHTLNVGRLTNEGDNRALEEIIRAAPKLKEIQHVRCSSALQMAAIRKTKKLGLISSMTIDELTETPIFRKLAANPPQITALTVKIHKTDSRHCLIALKAILVESQNSLQKLQFCEFPQQLDDLPVLHKLEELDLAVREPTSAVLPHLSNKCFPKLKKIRLGAMHGTEFTAFDSEITAEFIQKYFWQVCETPLEAVDKLELESYCDATAMKYLAEIFPRVTYVRLNYHKCGYGKVMYTRNPSDVWFLKTFPSLSKLNIIKFPFKVGIMDTFLTGIPFSIVKGLRTAPKQILSPCMSHILRPEGNILPLKNLRELTITAMPSRMLKPSVEHPFMSEVSIWYALELLPGLDMTILYCRKKRSGGIHEPITELREALEPAHNYVTIDQCHCTD